MSLTTVLLLLLGYILLGGATVAILLLVDNSGAPVSRPNTSTPHAARFNFDTSRLTAFFRKHWKTILIIVLIILGLIFHDVLAAIMQGVGILSIVAFAIMLIIKSVTKKKCRYQNYALLLGVVCIILSLLPRILPW